MTNKLLVAAQQALEALESLFSGQVDHERGKRCSDAITALRTALAEQSAEQKELDPKDIFVELVAKPVSGFAPTRTNGVRLTHRPTGISVEETDERSPHKNKHIAWEKLKQLVSAAEEAEQPAEQRANPVGAVFQKPVGYLYPTGRHPEFRFFQNKRNGVDGVPVYTAPQPTEQEPPAVKQIAEALRQVGLTLVRTGTGFRVADLGCVKAQTAPQPAKQPLTDEHELILIDGVEYAVQPQVAAEILRLHMANKTKRQRLSGLGKAAIGRKHFGNPIPQEWYAAANDLEAAHGITGETK